MMRIKDENQHERSLAWGRQNRSREATPVAVAQKGMSEWQGRQESTEELKVLAAQ